MSPTRASRTRRWQLHLRVILNVEDFRKALEKNRIEKWPTIDDLELELMF